MKKEQIFKEMPILEKFQDRFLVKYVLHQLTKGKNIFKLLQEMILICLKDEENLNSINKQ